MIPEYRAWHKKEKRMYEVRTIDFYEDGIVIAVKTGEKQGFNDILMILRVPQDADLIQSIGRKDNNGIEIFEGDVIENEEQIAIVKKDFCFGLDWAIKSKKPGWYCTCEDAFENCKVIGNKFKNPEYSTPILKKRSN